MSYLLRNHIPRGTYRQIGLSLIELMVAIAVGLVLMAGLLQVFINSSGVYRMQNDLIEMQQNGEFAMEYIARDVRNVGFWGCLRALGNVNNQLNTAGNTTYYGYTAEMSGLANQAAGTVVAGTDAITIRGATNIGQGLALQSPYPGSLSATVNVGAGSNVVSGNVLLISDCSVGDFFQVTGIDSSGNISHVTGSGSPGNASANLSKAYGAGTFLYRPYTRTYDIRPGSAAGNLPSLFVTDVTGSTELVEGVQSMVILYGEDTNGDGSPDRYVRANLVGNMDNVLAVRISLLMQTLNDFLTPGGQHIPYTFNGVTTTPTDQRLRRVYTTTILLRNRGL